MNKNKIKLLFQILFIIIFIGGIIGIAIFYHIEEKKKILIKEFYVDGYTKNDTNIDEVSWFLDGNGEYYFLLPKYMDRENIIPKITTSKKDAIINVYDEDGNNLGIITSGEKTNVFKNEKIILKVGVGKIQKKIYKINIIQSNISAMFINIDGNDEAYNNLINDKNHKTSYSADSFMVDEDGKVKQSKIKKIRGRGNATWIRTKKPYQIKFESKTSVLGMEKATTWNLLADHYDGTLSRNYLWLNLAKDLGLEYSVNCKDVDLYINNQYMGSYLITSKVETGVNRVDIGNEYLLEIDHNIDDFQITTNHGYVISIHNPKLDNSLDNLEETTRVMNDVKNKLDKIEEVIYNTNTTLNELSKYIDIESFAKFYWIQEFSENFDASRGSSYMYFKDGILYAGPLWDMDATLNRSYIYASMNEYYVTDNIKLNKRIKANWYRPLLKNKEFSNYVDNIFIDNIDVFETLYDKLNEHVDNIYSSAKMNYIKWDYKSMADNQPESWIEQDIDFDSSVEILKNNIKQRYNFYYSEYEDIIFDTLYYETIDKNGNTISGYFANGETITLPKTIDRKSVIYIYGIKDSIEKNKTKIAELYIDDKIQTIIVKHKTNSNYKICNAKYYYVKLKY